MANLSVAQSFKAESIVPECLDVAPNAKITVVYPGSKAVLFNELTPTEVRAQPEISWDADPSLLYTLAMIDPDAPSRATPTFREILHWLVVNIKGDDLSTGKTIAAYRGSGAPKGTGLHRYFFVVFQQPGPIAVSENDLETNRRNFSIRKFTQKYHLGNAIAGNYFQAQWDSSVPDRR